MTTSKKDIIGIIGFVITILFCFGCGIEQQSANQIAIESAALRKCEIFNEVSQVQSKLSSVGIGELRQWHNDGFGWTSTPPYLQTN